MPVPEFVRGILSGVRVIDLTRVLAGPYCTLMLADLGAQVIKIEDPDTPDPTRHLTDAGRFEIAPYFVSVNRSKLGMTLDLTKPEGQAILHDLVKNADVVVNNYRPGVLAKLGCDYETLRAANPRIINCSISGFGKTSPYKDRPAYDLIVQGMGGGMHLTGYPDSAPAVMGLHVGDQAGGLFGAFAIAAALFHREKTGEGQDIDIAMLDCQFSLLAFLGQTWLMGGPAPERSGTAHPLVAPFRAFKTSDGFVTLCAHHDKEWAALCSVLNAPDLTNDPRYGSVMGRATNRPSLYARLDDEFLKDTTDRWLDRLRAAQIPCGPVSTVPEALDDARRHNRNMVAQTENQFGRYELLGNPVKTTAQPDNQFGPPPAFGEHTNLILSELLGKTSTEIAMLRSNGAI